MRTSRTANLAALAVLALIAVLFFQPATGAEEGEMDGAKLFTETHKCNMCHAVPAADIEAKTQSEKMRGPDLGGPIKVEFEKLAAYLRKEADREGAKHTKEFKGSDEELQTILDWLGSLEAQE